MNLSDWLAALQHATSAAPPEGFATRDLATVMGISDAAARSLLRRWHRSGMIEHAGYRDEPRMDGRPGRIPIYRPTPGVLNAPQSSEEAAENLLPLQSLLHQEGASEAEAFIRASAARPKRAGRRPN